MNDRLKLKRPQAAKRYRHELDSLYAEDLHVKDDADIEMEVMLKAKL